MIEAVAVIVSLLAVFFAGSMSGRARAEKRQAQDYREQRGKLDDADLGLGATDDQRIDRLRKIANGG